MPTMRNPFRRGDVAKAVPALPTAGTHDLATILNALAPGRPLNDASYPFAELPRNPADLNQFGPGTAFAPRPLDRPRDDGRADPRFREYPVAWNLQIQPTPYIPFQTLGDASRNIDMIRRCVELRKKEIAAREWTFGVSAAAVNQEALKSPGSSKVDIQARMNKEFADDIAKANEFWSYPGRSQDYDWESWLFAAMEQYLVYDALTIFPKRTYGKELLSLDLVDGATIKPLLDARGGKPEWPFPAFQQVLYGLPRGEFTRTAVTLDNGDVVVPNSYTRDQMYYIPRHVRVDSPYGMSAVEQALISARLYLKRQGWMLSEYDDGVLPRAWLEWATTTADLFEMDAHQRRQLQDALNDELGGDTAKRQRLTMLVPGLKAVETKSVEERYKPDYDLFLIKLLATHFDVPVSQLGFSEVKGLGGSAFHEGQADNQERQGTLPDTRWLSRQITRISREQLGVRPGLEHRFLGLDQEDEAAQDAVWENRVRSGRATLNEDRARLNLPMYEFAEADMPMLEGQRGIVYIEGSSKLAPPGTMIEPAEFKPEVPGETEQQQNAKPAAQQKAAERAAFNKWAARHPDPVRTFKLEHLTPEDAPDLADDPRITWRS